MIAARLNAFPWGKMKFDQGDFHTDRFKANFSVAAFRWSNDDDNNSYTDAPGASTDPERADLEGADGWELSAGLRGHGLSVTAALNGITGDTIDPAFSGGLYANGTTDLDQVSLIGGYMVVNERFEIVLGWQSQDADGYMDRWERTQFGLNYFYDRHKVKAQLTYTMGQNLFGETGVDAVTTQLQLQNFF